MVDKVSGRKSPRTIYHQHEAVKWFGKRGLEHGGKEERLMLAGVSGWREKGTREGSIKALKAIAGELRVDVDDLI